ncbi:MAG: AmmeMemoRadiSam system protein B [Nitrospirota bacterium]|nr:AmmeMemoRadiSam system protein B [Nitrospirota bacterium]
MRRTPAVAGHFYSNSPSLLHREVEEFVEGKQQKVDAIGLLSPHAGFVYSGRVAGALYSRITMPDSFVIMGPNHTGMGAEVSIMSSGTWDMPNGPVDIDATLAATILQNCDMMEEDRTAHLREHSIEVQLPFIQYFCSAPYFVPIVLMTGRYDTLHAVGEALASAIKNSGKKVTIVASSDMSHYVPAEVAKKKDGLALEHLLRLDPEGLYRTVRERGISMCGFGPAVAMLVAAKALGATTAEQVMYMTSGDVNHDYSSVVGYAGVVVR